MAMLCKQEVNRSAVRNSHKMSLKRQLRLFLLLQTNVILTNILVLDTDVLLTILIQPILKSRAYNLPHFISWYQILIQLTEKSTYRNSNKGEKKKKKRMSWLMQVNIPQG